MLSTVTNTAGRPFRNSLLLYLLLAVVALASVLFHVRSVEQIFPQWFGITRAAWPFLLEAGDKPHFLLDVLRENARKAGLQDKDQLIALSGVPCGRDRPLQTCLRVRSLAPYGAFSIEETSNLKTAAPHLRLSGRARGPIP